MKLVIIESPFAPNELHTVDEHIDYARLCMHDSLMRNEAPYASHLLYTQDSVLDDTIPEERKLGIDAGFAWKHVEGVLTVFYTDLGYSKGMKLAIEYCRTNHLPYKLRSLHV